MINATSNSDSGGAPAYRLLADKIIKQILAGDHPVGSLLPPEIELAEQFGVHRSTVREGIRLLEEAGMLRRKSMRRMVVAVPEQSRLAERGVQALLMRRVSILTMYEANLALEPVFARLAASQATDSQIARLRDNVDATRSGLHEHSLEALDAQFHQLLAEATNNPALMIVRQPLQDLFIPMVAALVRAIDTRHRMVDAHSAIVDAIVARDGERAEKWMRQHVEDFKRGMIRAGLDMTRVVALNAEPLK